MERHVGRMAWPGSLKELLKGLKAGDAGSAAYEWMDPDPAFADPTLRLHMLDQQNIEMCILHLTDAGCSPNM